jgi:hypothetical protein
VEDLPGAAAGEFAARPPVEIPGFAIDIRNTLFYGLCRDCEKETTALGR